MRLFTPRPMALCGAALLLALTAAGCTSGCRKIDPQGPEPIPPPLRERPALLSTLSVPVAIPVDEVSALVNRVVKQDLYSVRDRRVKKGILSARIDLDIRRNGPIYTRTRGGKIINHLPLLAEGRVRAAGISRPFATTFTIHATTDISLNEDWATVARTQGDFTWEETPYITVLGLKFGLKGAAENALTKQLAQLAPRIDSLIADRINLRRRVERIWESLREPLAIRDEPPAWLTIRPVETYFSPGVSQNDTFVVGLQIHAYVETTVGAMPPLPALGVLPPLRLLSDSLAADSLHGFQVNLPVSITYDDARILLAGSIAGKDYAMQEQVAFTVNAIDLYGHGPSLVARVDFSANVTGTSLGTNGRVFLTGTPIYDNATQSVRVDSFDYDVNSSNALAEAANLWFRDDLLEQTRARLVFSLAENIAAAKERLEAALRNRVLGKHIILDGTIDELVPDALYLVHDGINVDIFARGRLTARLHALDQIRRRPRIDTTATHP